jgi:hypothetical protein
MRQCVSTGYRYSNNSGRVFCQNANSIRLNSTSRMEEMKEMKQNKHGQYSEITDEKEVVRVSASVQVSAVCILSTHPPCADENQNV